MKPRYDHLYVIAFSLDSDNRERDDPAEIMGALRRRVREEEATGEILEAVGVPDETIDRETGLDIRARWLLRDSLAGVPFQAPYATAAANAANRSPGSR